MEPMSKAQAKIYKELQEERERAPQEPIAPIIAVDPMAAAHATIKMDGRTGRAFTKVENIVPDPDQPRKSKSMDVEEIGQLAGSLKSDKQIQPIVVEWKPEISRWMIVIGERRWLAAIAAGIEMIACVFHFKPLTPGERLKIQMGENLHRKDFSDMERAEGFKRLMELNGWTQTQLAKEIHLHPGTISRALQLLQPTDEPELRGATEDELRGATQPAKRRGKGGPKPGKVRTFKTANGCKVTLAFKDKPTDEEIREALREVLEQISEERQAA